MREILFRAFIKDKTKIYTVKKIDFDYSTVWFEEENKPTDSMRMFDQIELMQFTGLTDKNGKKIFEGDIVKEKDCVHNGKIQIKGKIFTVEYKDGVFIMVYPERLFKSYLYLMVNDIEVIGNIHDNPELLGEEQ